MFETQRSPGFIFSAANKAYESAMDKRLQHLNVTVIQWCLLDQLYQHEGINQRELAQYCMKDPSSLTKTVDLLEKKELIVRKQDTNDRRAFKLYLTAKGSKIRNEAYQVADEFYQIATENISKADLEEMNRIAIAIIENINKRT